MLEQSERQLVHGIQPLLSCFLHFQSFDSEFLFLQNQKFRIGNNKRTRELNYLRENDFIESIKLHFASLHTYLTYKIGLESSRIDLQILGH